ncbi:MAG TPA: hypothetical protein DCY53_03555 [Desulfobacteraceae bacterium]|jgi:hypothetical protein|nr:hypothetical protein [Desulfobacteraceae bacterium]
MSHSTTKESTWITWIVIVLLLAWILGKGFFSFFVVGDLGQPTWNYRPIKDVPGESPYAVYQVQPFPQHVKGTKGE